MGLSIGIGFQNYHWDDEADAEEIVKAIVEAGHCPLLRDKVGDEIVEARRTDAGVSTRWLAGKELAAINKDYAALATASVTIPYEAIDDMARHYLTTLALPSTEPARFRLAVPALEKLDGCRASSLETALTKVWKGKRSEFAKHAIAMHRFALTHAFAIHSE